MSAEQVRRSFIAAVLSVLLALVGLAVLTPAANADTAPPSPSTPATVSADALPTVQANGVVWSQTTVANTVYATGAFTSVRPAGSVAGANQTTRNNLLAYDITTGNLITSFAHSLNAQGIVVAASPDGSRLYVGGDFTTVDGASHVRIAAFNTATGALVSTFSPSVNARVKAIAATNTTVYFGGSFTTVDGVARGRLAAVSASNGALLNWSPSADDYSVAAMVLAPSGKEVIVGGQFTTLNGVAAPGLGALDPVSGATLSWAANQLVQDSGANAGITSLRTDGKQVYGTGFVFGAGGNLEGSFAASPDTGAINWIEDCHGDTYDTFATGSVMYAVSHEHFCGNIGSFPQTDPWTFYRATAFTTYPTGTIAPNTLGDYTDWGGNPDPTQLDWYPTLTTGTYTGQNQAAWSVTGNASYVALGGEFPTVNGTAQQDLVRFAVRSIAPNKIGPRSTASLTPSVKSFGSGTARVSWQATSDQDNEALTYKVVRDGNTAAPVYTTTVDSTFYNLPSITFTDTGLAAGSTHTYRVYVYDPLGNSQVGSTVSVTISSATISAYAAGVLNDDPDLYWPLDEASGPTAADISGNQATGTYAGGVTYRTASSVTTPGAAVTLNGSDGVIVGNTQLDSPTTYSEELWFNTTTTSGGKLIGFGNSAGDESTNFDRHVYMLDSGQLAFGVYTGQTVTITTPAAYNDGKWHQVVATQGPDGMTLYVDGQQVGTNSETGAQTYSGYWRVGGDTLGGWPGQPSSDFFAGSVDEVAVYPSVLPAARVLAHYQATKPANKPPVAAFTSSCASLACSFNGSASSDPDGAVAGYAWAFGDGATGVGAAPKHTYAKAGTYQVSLTVTDNLGAKSAAKVNAVKPTAPSTTLASDTFNRTVAGGLGTANLGGAWTAIVPAANLSVAPGAASFTMPKASTAAAAYLGGVSNTNTETDVTLTTTKAGTGSGIYAYVVGRRISLNNEYHARLNIVGGKVTLSMSRLTGAATDVAVGPAVVLTGVTYKPGLQLRVRFQVTGTKPTTLRLKVWNAAVAQPAAWQITATDSTAVLQAKGTAGLRAYLSGNATGAPIVVKASNFQEIPSL